MSPERIPAQWRLVRECSYGLPIQMLERQKTAKEDCLDGVHCGEENGDNPSSTPEEPGPTSGVFFATLATSKVF